MTEQDKLIADFDHLRDYAQKLTSAIVSGNRDEAEALAEFGCDFMCTVMLPSEAKRIVRQS